MFETLLAHGERLARVETNRAILRFVNGIDWLVRDSKAVVGRTPYDVVLKQGKLEVRRYRHPAAGVRARFPIPVLLIPPLMVKPFIFDLFPNRSLVSFLLENGYTVYLVDFGEPDRADALVTLDNYVLDWLPAAIGAVKRASGVDEVTLLGYCMGGLFAFSLAAVSGDPSIRNIVSIAAPVDTAKMGLFAWMAKAAGGQVDFLARRIGNVPGGLSSTVFRLLAPMKNVTRYADLFMNMWNREYVNGFDAMNEWVGQFIDYPQEAFRQFVRDFMQHNKLARGKMTFRGKVADLKKIRASLLVIAGKTDAVAPIAAVKAALETVGSPDMTFKLAPGGHMGVFAGSSAPEHVWKIAAEWLAPRSQLTSATVTAKGRGRAARRSASAGREQTNRKAKGSPDRGARGRGARRATERS